MKKTKDVKVELTVDLNCNHSQYEELEKLINKGYLNGHEYNLDIVGLDNYKNKITKLHLIMNTQGSYEDNLDRIRTLHTKIEELLKVINVEYKGMSLIPNKVEWN